MKGGYQIIDIAPETITSGVGVRIADAYAKLSATDKRAVIRGAKTSTLSFPDFEANFLKASNGYIAKGVSVGNKAYDIEVKSDDTVTFTEGESDAAVAEKVSDLEERADAVIGSQFNQVDITSSTLMNPYTCPSDGYVRALVKNVATNVISVAGLDSGSHSPFSLIKLIGNTTADQYASVYVHKGQLIFTELNTGNDNTVVFRPLA